MATGALLAGGAILGGVLGGLGSDDASTTETDVDQITRSEIRDFVPPEFRQLRGRLASGLGDFLRNPEVRLGDETLAADAQRFAAPITEAERGALARIIGSNLIPSEQEFLTRSLLSRTLGGEFLSPESNPFLRGAIETAQRPIRERAEEQRLANRALFTRSGQRIDKSSPFARAQAIQQRGELNALGDVGTRIAFENLARERAIQAQAPIVTAEVLNAELARTTQALQAVALPRLIQQLGIDRALEEFQQRRDAILQAAAIAAGVTQPRLAQRGSRVTGEGSASVSVNPFLGVLSGAQAGVGAASTFA